MIEIKFAIDVIAMLVLEEGELSTEKIFARVQEETPYVVPHSTKWYIKARLLELGVIEPVPTTDRTVKYRLTPEGYSTLLGWRKWFK